MTPAPNPSSGSIAFKLWSARISLLAERIAASFHWLFIWVSVFAILSLFAIGSIWLTGAFWLGFVALFFFAARRFSWPTQSEAATRLEKETGILHRPLTSMDDTPAAPLSGNRKALWQQET